MATRQNKKRKGRNNAPPRERTVTTLTDGPDGPFLTSSSLSVDDHSSPTLMSPPFTLNVNPPIPGSQLTPGIVSGPYTVSSFSSPFSYGLPMSGLPPAAQFQSPQLFPPTSQHQQTQVVPQPPTQHQQRVLPPGKNDLEILEKLKETIKNNQHELFRPIPQPAALASAYLGPRSSISTLSTVSPHPEQVPVDSVPPGLTLNFNDSPPAPPTKSGEDATPAPGLNRATSACIPQTSDLKNDTKKPVHRASVSESPKTNTMQPPASQLPGKRLDRYDSNASSTSVLVSSKQEKSDAGDAKRTMNVDASPRMEPPGLGRHNQSSRPPEITESSVPISAKPPSADTKEDLRHREPGWTSRNGFLDRDRPEIPGNQSDARITNGNLQTSNGDNRGSLSRDQKPFDRERERGRERERDRSRERDYGRFRDDRRLDDRARSPSGDRRYQRYPPRRYDSKASEVALTPAGRTDRNGPDSRPPPRNLGEERAIVRPPLNVSAPGRASAEDRRGPTVPVADDRSVRPAPPPLADDKRGPASPPVSERPIRPNDDNRVPAPAIDRQGRADERRPLPPPATDRPGLGVDARRRAPSPTGNDRAARSFDDRHAAVPPLSSLHTDRMLRSGNDRQLPVPAAAANDRLPLPAGEDRRPPVSTSGDRSTRPAEDRRLEERISRLPAAGPTDSSPTRKAVEDRGIRPTASSDDRNARPVPLEDRISRVPSLQERLSHPAPTRPDDRPIARLEDRLSRPTNAPSSLEERLSNPPTVDSRPLRPVPDERSRQPPLPTGPVFRPSDERPALAEPARPPPSNERVLPHTDDRHFVPAGRFARPASPALSDRGHPPPRPLRAPSVAPSVARDELRPYRPSSPARPLSRSDAREREFHPAGDHRDRVDDVRPPYRPEPARYPPERRSDLMDVDSTRFSDARPSYRRPSPPPAEQYPPRASDRTWVPAGEAPSYRDRERDREGESARRPPADSHVYAREWREGERVYGDEWNERSWDRTREYDRDGRFPSERDAVASTGASASGWETREERERRTAYPPPPHPPPALSELPPSTMTAAAAVRSYESRPLSSRLADSYPDERGYPVREGERARYPPEPPAYSRVRARSPSPLRRGVAGEDLRPPVKRLREYGSAGGGGGGYYAVEEPRAPAEYPPRLRTPPPAPPVVTAVVGGSGFYDDVRYSHNRSPGGGRDRDYLDSRGGGYGYDRRDDPSLPAGRMHPPHSPPPLPYGRPAYGRDDRRYSVPPRG